MKNRLGKDQKNYRSFKLSIRRIRTKKFQDVDLDSIFQKIPVFIPIKARDHCGG
jgi:hypothetical protein